jgi:cysteinyl-tRNA synthetase
MEQDVGGVLGVGISSPEKVLHDIARIRSQQNPMNGASTRPSETEIQEAILARSEARKSKDFGKADSIRKELESRGVLIKDGPSGTTWEYN